jgi:hypothetical protein
MIPTQQKGFQQYRKNMTLHLGSLRILIKAILYLIFPWYLNAPAFGTLLLVLGI